MNKPLYYFLIPLIFIGIIPMLNAQTDGCCLTICKQTSQNECQEQFQPNTTCGDIEYCNIGCCVDDENYCFDNFLGGRCSFDFYKKNCDEVDACNINASLRTKKTPVISPISGYLGAIYKITYNIFNPSEINNLIASINYNHNEIDRITLYDDGEHGDRNRNDGVYGNVWDSISLGRFNGINQYFIDVTINFNNGSAAHLFAVENFTIVDNLNCLPLIYDWKNPLESSDIIFVGNQYDDISTGKDFLNRDVERNINDLLSVYPFNSSINQINFYRVDGKFNFNSNQQILDRVNQECNFFNNSQDTIILLDKGNAECLSPLPHLIITDPNSRYYPANQEYTDITNAFRNLCSFIVTEEQIQNQLEAENTPPTPTIITPNETIFLNANPTIQFYITDNLDPNIKYYFYFNGTLKEQGIILNNSMKNITIANLAEGSYYYAVVGEDGQNNQGDSGVYIMYINTSETEQPNPEVNVLFPANNSQISASTDINVTG